MLMSIRMPVSVLIMETASAPALSAASAISEISVTFGESFHHQRLFLQCARTAFVMSSTPAQLVPNCTPPCFTFGQEMFISDHVDVGVIQFFPPWRSNPPGVLPAMFAMMVTPARAATGDLFR